MKNTIQVTLARIEVTRNEHIACGYYFDLKFAGILPGCKREAILHHNTMYGYIWVKPLFKSTGQSGRISPEAWRTLIATVPVVAYRGEEGLVITPELEAMARADIAKFATMAEEALATATWTSELVFDEVVMAQKKVA